MGDGGVILVMEVDGLLVQQRKQNLVRDYSVGTSVIVADITPVRIPGGEVGEA